MKTNKILLILLCLFLLVSCNGKAKPPVGSIPPPGEKTDAIKGFLGVRWLEGDDAFSKGDCNFNVSNMLNWGVLGLSTYTCYLEIESYGALGSSQALSYYNEQFFMGTVIFEGKTEFEKLVNNIYNQHGKPTEVIDKKDAWQNTMEYKYRWVMNKVVLQLKYDPQEMKGSLSMIYTPISVRIDRVLMDKKRVDTWNDQLKIEDLY
jgi:hypothetical protein